MHLPYTAPCDQISDDCDVDRKNITNLRRAFSSSLSKLLNWSCTSWHCVVLWVILSMAEEEDRCVHQVTAGLENRTDGGKSAPKCPSRSTNERGQDIQSNKQARVSLWTRAAPLCAATNHPTFADHCSKSLPIQYAIAVQKHRLQTTHIICSPTPHDSAVLEARAPETHLRHNRL